MSENNAVKRLSCAIVITSYNKAEFLAASIESALAQDYADTKIIVVDDGSRDHSLEVLASYKGRVVAFAKTNGGQASAFNLAVANTRADIIFFLDGDDTLLPDTVSRTVAAWTPGMSKVHFKLQRMQENGTPIAGSFLPKYEALPSGDLTEMLQRYAFYASPPTSGNAFGREFLLKVSPIPEQPYRSGADTYLIGLAPLYGKVGALDGIGGHWRLSAKNSSAGGLSVLRNLVNSEVDYVTRLQGRIRESGASDDVVGRWPQHLRNLLVVRKFSSGQSPNWPSLPAVALSFVRATMFWPGYQLRVRVKFIAWGLALGLVPAGLLRRVPNIAGPAIDVMRD